jgi:hypothetical protein
MTWELLDSLGFANETRPDGSMPTLPADVTELTDQTLMARFAALTEWTCYAAAQLAMAKGEQREGQAAVRAATALAMSKVTGERTVSGRKAAAAADPDVREAEDQLDRDTNLVEALEMVHENAKSRAQFMSRELSRRIAMRDTQNRNDKWGV